MQQIQSLQSVQHVQLGQNIQQAQQVQQVQVQQVQQVQQGGRVQPRIIQQIIRPGQILPNGQQLIIQNGKPVLINAPANALPQGKIVLTQKGQVIQGAQAQALAGKIINTSQGQFIIGANGQLLSTQKLIQNHLTSQAVKYVTVNQQPVPGQPGAGAAATRVMLGSGGVITSTPTLVTSTVGSLQQRVVQSATSSQGGRNLTSSLHGTLLTSSPLPPGSSHTVSVSTASVPGSSYVPGSNSGSSSNPASSTPGSSSNPVFNRVILNALSNRGLLSQQNGKFVYVGNKTGSSAPASKPNIQGRCQSAI